MIKVILIVLTGIIGIIVIAWSVLDITRALKAKKVKDNIDKK